MAKKVKIKISDYYYEIRLWRQFLLPVLILLAVCIVGVVGFVTIDKFSLLEAMYMVVVTLTTVGFRPVKGMSPVGMVFDMFFILIGIILIVVVIGRALEFIVSGDFIRIRRRKLMEKKIDALKNHFVICGFGRVGHQVATEFKAWKIPFVVIDSKPETAVELEPEGIPYLIGDITSDIVLEEAGIKRAKGLIASADSDTSNVFVALSARVLNPNLYIIARASSVDAESKLKKAGANRVISPYFIGGRRIAQMATRPTAIDFLDTVLYSEHLEMEIREFQVDGGCGYAGKTLGEAQIRQKSGAYIAAIRKTDGSFNLQPVAESKIDHGDILVAIGTPKQLDLLERCLIT